MPTTFFTRFITLFAYLSCALAMASPSATAGAEAAAPPVTWIGQYRLAGTAVTMLLHADPQGRSAVLDLPAQGRRGLPLKHFHLDAATARFELRAGRTPFRFDGERSDNTISGRLSQGGQQGSFSLLKLVPVTAALAREVAGSYQLGPGHIIDIGPMDEMDGQLVFLDHQTRRMGVLYGLSTTRFAAGPTLGQPLPLRLQANVVRGPDGAITALNWQDEQGGATAVRIAPHRIEDVTVVNGGVTLRGSLSLPVGPGPHPAIVFAHGSGDSTRNVGVWNSFFLRQGMAVLSLDKRGAGQSDGDWRKATLHDIAGDWGAGVAMLKARADIDPRRIGVHGSSQGGWTGALMAAAPSDIAFLIVRAGSAAPLRATMLHEIGWSVREAGFGDAAAHEAQRGSDQLFALAGGAWGPFRHAAAPLKARPWAAAAWPVHMTQDGWGRHWSALNGDFDPRPALEKIRVPVLWFLGEHDHNVPSAVSAERLAAAAAVSGNTDLTVVRLASAGHAFMETDTGNGSEFASFSHAAPGYWDAIQAWLRERRFSNPGN